MRFELFIASRYLRAKRRQAFIGIITGDLHRRRRGRRGFADRGSGRQQRLSPGFAGPPSGIDRAHQPVAHRERWHSRTGVRCSISLNMQPHVVAAAPAIYEQVLISRGPRARGAVLKGMLPRYERKVSDLLQTVNIGSAADLEESSTVAPAPSPAVAAGDLARRTRKQHKPHHPPTT